MGTSVVQCLDCKEWNWEGVTTCKHCGSTNLTIGFHQLLAYMKSKEKEKQSSEIHSQTKR